MEIIAVIPARYASTRLPGKSLKDICGKPMLWWVYRQVEKIRGIREVVCAVDDVRIADVCESLGMKYVMTSAELPEHISQIHEVSEKIPADVFTCQELRFHILGAH